MAQMQRSGLLSEPGLAETINPSKSVEINGDVMATLEVTLGRYKIMTYFASVTGLPKVQLFAALALLGTILIGSAFGSDGLCNLVGFIYPCRETIKVLRDVNSGINDFKFWAHYWLIFGMFVTFESLLDELLEFVPYFVFLKMVFLVFCFLRGATLVFNVVVDPAYYWLQKQFDNQP